MEKIHLPGVTRVDLGDIVDGCSILCHNKPCETLMMVEWEAQAERSTRSSELLVRDPGPFSPGSSHLCDLLNHSE